MQIIKEFLSSSWKALTLGDTKKQMKELFVLLFIAVLIRTFGFGMYQVPTGSMETTMLVGERFFADKFTVLFKPIKRGDIISFNDPLYPYSKNKFVFLLQNYVGLLWWGPANWTKRVIGIPGDTIKGALINGKTAIYVNGEKLEESYLNRYPLVPISFDTWRSYDPSQPYDDQPFYNMDMFSVKQVQRLNERWGVSTIKYPGTPLPSGHGRNVFEITLGNNQYWAMGDNRLGSSDSRVWGILNGDLIHGKIIWRIFSLDSHHSLESKYGQSVPFFVPLALIDFVWDPIVFCTRIRWDRCFQNVK